MSQVYRNLIHPNSEAPPALAFAKRYAFDADDNLVYEGWAVPGTATSAAGWAIKRYTYVAADGSPASYYNRTEEAWASGTSDMSSVWDNRAVLVYS
jgi:hypothetical protein